MNGPGRMRGKHHRSPGLHLLLLVLCGALWCQLQLGAHAQAAGPSTQQATAAAPAAVASRAPAQARPAPTATQPAPKPAPRSAQAQPPAAAKPAATQLPLAAALVSTPAGALRGPWLGHPSASRPTLQRAAAKAAAARAAAAKAAAARAAAAKGKAASAGLPPAIPLPLLLGESKYRNPQVRCAAAQAPAWHTKPPPEPSSPCEKLGLPLCPACHIKPPPHHPSPCETLGLLLCMRLPASRVFLAAYTWRSCRLEAAAFV